MPSVFRDEYDGRSQDRFRTTTLQLRSVSPTTICLARPSKGSPHGYPWEVKHLAGEYGAIFDRVASMLLKRRAGITATQNQINGYGVPESRGVV
ncbi:MAG: hypothetical protein JO266_06820 [Acidobacteria bacterium]|nr:hypothetical protein [Acidobacteriota bacterium]